jgi:hypothetical protein
MCGNIWELGLLGWSERVLRDFTEGSSLNPYSTPLRQTWGTWSEPAVG